MHQNHLTTRVTKPTDEDWSCMVLRALRQIVSIQQTEPAYEACQKHNDQTFAVSELRRNCSARELREQKVSLEDAGQARQSI